MSEQYEPLTLPDAWNQWLKTGGSAHDAFIAGYRHGFGMGSLMALTTTFHTSKETS